MRPEGRCRQRFSDLRFGTLALKDTKLSFVAGVIPSGYEEFIATALVGAAIRGSIGDIANSVTNERERDTIRDLVMRVEQACTLGDVSGYREFGPEIPEYLQPIAYTSEVGGATMMRKGLTERTALSLDNDRLLLSSGTLHPSQAFVEECRFADENGYYHSPSGL